jgi:hypothetical protein
MLCGAIHDRSFWSKGKAALMHRYSIENILCQPSLRFEQLRLWHMDYSDPARAFSHGETAIRLRIMSHKPSKTCVGHLCT